MARVTIEDLKRIRDASRRSLATRPGASRARLIMHMGTCGIAAGAREVMAALLAEVEKRSLSDVMVMTSSCAGLCSKEPMMTVELEGQAPVKYAELTADSVRRVLEEHVLGGRIVAELALGRGSETTA